MTKNFIKVSENTLAIDAAKIMEENKIFSLVVTNNYKKVIGVITMHSLIESRIL